MFKIKMYNHKTERWESFNQETLFTDRSINQKIHQFLERHHKNINIGIIVVSIIFLLVVLLLFFLKCKNPTHNDNFYQTCIPYINKTMNCLIDKGYYYCTEYDGDSWNNCTFIESSIIRQTIPSCLNKGSGQEVYSYYHKRCFWFYSL